MIFSDSRDMKLYLFIPFFVLGTFVFSQKTNYTKPSKSVGTVSNGSLINAYRFQYKTRDYKYFSRLSYHILGRANVHSDVYAITIEALKNSRTFSKDHRWRLMECSKRKGGRMFPHHTHQNGTSIDFMTPMLRKGKSYRLTNGLGVFHYLLKYTPSGSWGIRRKVKVDFDLMAQFILELDKVARLHGMKIKKVILRTNLKDEFYATKHGDLVKKKGIYLVMSLPKIVNEQHDEHFHVDFEWL